jgi:DNA-binding HxlR family transcriptional regulator
MGNPIRQINKTFESRVRLGIMSILMVNRSSDFNTLKDVLEITDGNLASHLRALESEGMITVSKQFIGRKPNTSYFATEKGHAAFTSHLNALEKLIHGKKQ